MKKFRVLIVSLLLITMMPLAVFAQGGAETAEYPNGPVTVVVNRKAGGGSDLVARLITPYIEKYLGTTCPVMNVTAGDGIVGLNQAATANPDGYNLLICATNEIALALEQPAVIEFEDMNGFEYFGGFNSRGHMLVAKKGSPFKTFQDVVDYAKKHPGELTVGIPGNGLVKPVNNMMKAAGIELTIVNSGSGKDVNVQLMGGHIDLGFPGVQFYDTLVESGCTPLAQSTTSRDAGNADLATFKELGYDFSYEIRMFLAGPAGLPENVRAALNDAVAKTLADPEFKQSLIDAGEKPAFMNGEEITAFLADFIKNWF